MPVFETGAFNHSATFPVKVLTAIYNIKIPHTVVWGIGFKNVLRLLGAGGFFREDDLGTVGHMVRRAGGVAVDGCLH